MLECQFSGKFPTYCQVLIRSRQISQLSQTQGRPITETACEEDIIVVRLFVLEKVLFGLGAKKVDSILHGALGKCPNILHGALGKCPNILRIELEGLLRSLTQDEMQEAAAEAQSTLQALRDRVMAPNVTAEPDSGTN